jgi:hypothetical protein
MESRGNEREQEEHRKLTHIYFEGSTPDSFFQGSVCVSHTPSAFG